MLMDDLDIVSNLLHGDSLRIRMVPDPSVPGNHPEHVETYDLPHVISNGGLFWAKSETNHLTTPFRDPNSHAAFCYTNSGELFMSFTPGKANSVYVMNKRRYRDHKWILKKNYRLIWDSDSKHPAEAIAKEIDVGAKLKIAMRDSEDIWNIHPVDLPKYYPATATFELRTVNDCYVQLFRYPKKLLDHLETIGFTERAAKDPTGTIHKMDLPIFYTFYLLYSDGTYQSIYDIPRQSQQTYKTLKVFSDTI